jgi:hypothetical protein
VAIDIVLVEVRAHSCKPAFGNKITPFSSVSIGRLCRGPRSSRGGPHPIRGLSRGPGVPPNGPVRVCACIEVFAGLLRPCGLMIAGCSLGGLHCSGAGRSHLLSEFGSIYRAARGWGQPLCSAGLWISCDTIVVSPTSRPTFGWGAAAPLAGLR